MPQKSQPVSPLTMAGLRPGEELLYRRILRSSGASRQRLTEITGLSLAELDEVVTRLADAGLVRLSADTVTAEPPVEALGRVLEQQTRRLARDAEQVDALRNLVPSLAAEHLTSLGADGAAASHVGVQAVLRDDVAGLLRELVTESAGDVLWFRPDQWRLPVGREGDALVRDLVEAGRTSRALYPARVLEEAPDVLRTRAGAGELIRVVAVVPSRMVVLGREAALVPDRWGGDTGRRLVIREQSLVAALADLFESHWEHAMSVPGLGGSVSDHTGDRQLLLQQLTRGARDEQIARTLGISLRTVRRRVAELMAELGVESRFQAGVEAVRRGWV